MANTEAPNGFKPIGYVGGGPYNGACRKYYVASTYATALFIGDTVLSSGSGDADGVPGVAQGAEGGAILGVIVGIEPDPDNLSREYIPASTGGYVYVADDPDLLFEAQADGSFTVADIGLNCDAEHATAGSTTTGRSGMALDVTTKATTAAQWRLIGFVQTPDNESGDYVRMICQINEHERRTVAGGV